MKLLFVMAAFIAALAAVPAGAADPPLRTLVGNATASVNYFPDLARVRFAIREEKATAAEASGALNDVAAKLLASVREYGVPESDLQTANYSLYYSRPDSVPSNRPTPPPTYVASQSFIITVPIARTGGLIDRAVAAGANTDFSLTYDTTHREALYREALAHAVEVAHERAAVAARAAGVTLGPLQTLNIGGGTPPVPFSPNGTLNQIGRAQVAPGIQFLSANVEAIYTVR